jgi:hypothetical protein
VEVSPPIRRKTNTASAPRRSPSGTLETSPARLGEAVKLPSPTKRP